MVHLDVLVIGGGTAGEYAAGYSMGEGRSVGIAERGSVGGACIFNACIPTKALVHAARTYKKLKHADFYGLPTVTESAQYQKVKAFKEGIVGSEASTMICELAVAMTTGATASKVDDLLHSYPTFSEGIRYACQATT